MDEKCARCSITVRDRRLLCDDCLDRAGEANRWNDPALWLPLAVARIEALDAMADANADGFVNIWLSYCDVKEERNAVTDERDAALADLARMRAFANATLRMGPTDDAHIHAVHHGLLDANGQPTALLRGDAPR